MHGVVLGSDGLFQFINEKFVYDSVVGKQENAEELVRKAQFKWVQVL